MEKDRIEALKKLVKLMGEGTNENVVNVKGNKIRYVEAGSGKALILLHGSTTGSSVWYPVIKPLSAHFRVIVPDIIGYGESDKPVATYDKHFFATWLKDFYEVIGLEKASVMGMTQGGAIAMQFAIDYPQLVEKLLLLSPMGLKTKMTLKGALDIYRLFLFTNLKHVCKYCKTYPVLNPDSIDDSIGVYTYESIKMVNGNIVFKKGLSKPVSPIPKSELSKIIQPTLGIWGELDFAYTTGRIADVAKIIPNFKTTAIPGGGHVPYFDKLDEFNKVVIDFVSR